MIGRYYTYFFFVGVEIIYKVRESESLRAVLQHSIQLTELGVFSWPAGMPRVERPDTSVIGLL